MQFLSSVVVDIEYPYAGNEAFRRPAELPGNNVVLANEKTTFTATYEDGKHETPP